MDHLAENVKVSEKSVKFEKRVISGRTAVVYLIFIFLSLGCYGRLFVLNFIN